MSTTIDFQGWEYTPTDNSHLIGRPIIITETFDEAVIYGPRKEMLEQGARLQALLPGIDIHWAYTGKP